MAFRFSFIFSCLSIILHFLQAKPNRHAVSKLKGRLDCCSDKWVIQLFFHIRIVSSNAMVGICKHIVCILLILSFILLKPLQW